MITEIKHPAPQIKHILCLSYKTGAKVTLHYTALTEQVKISASVQPMPTVNEMFQAVMAADEWRDGALLYPGSEAFVPPPTNDR